MHGRRHLVFCLPTRTGSCSDPVWNVTASFRSCQVPWPVERADAISIVTYTNVTVPRPVRTGNILYQIFLSNGGILGYNSLNETPNAQFLNASRCASESVGGQTYSYCVNFTDLTMSSDVDGTELRVEVTPDPFSANASTSCIIIVVQGTYP